MGEYFATHPPSIPLFGRGELKQDTHSFRNLSLQFDQIISTHPALAQANSIFLEKVHLVAVLCLSVPLVFAQTKTAKAICKTLVFLVCTVRAGQRKIIKRTRASGQIKMQEYIRYVNWI